MTEIAKTNQQNRVRIIIEKTIRSELSKQLFNKTSYFIASASNIRKFLHLIYSRELKAIHGNLILSL